MGARTYSARVMRFRRGVYAHRDEITPGCQVLLLRLSDDMNGNAIVSIPRSRLADELDCPPVRITEWINQAFEAGFLDRVRRGRPGVTAVYQGLVKVREGVPSEVREGVPSQRYATTNQAGVREGVPLSEPQRYARAVPQEVVRAAANGTALRVPTDPTTQLQGEDPMTTLTLRSRIRSRDDHDHTRDITASGETYDAANDALEAQVPEGWLMLFVRRES